MKDRYRRVHGVYDILCTAFSLGAIDRCRAAALAGVRAGERILLAGCGSAPEAAAALDASAEVTLVDRSPAMLARARRRLTGRGAPDGRAAPAGRTAHFVEDDVRMFRDRCVAEGTAYDRVVANFLLNVFAETEARAMLATLRDLTAPGGRLFVGDFAPPGGPGVGRWIQSAYWWTASAPFSFLTGDARHPVHDYAAWAEGAGLAVAGIEDFPVLVRGVPCFRCTATRKPAAGTPRLDRADPRLAASRVRPPF